jgi:dihydroflavonol-4-reductase
LLEPLLDPVSVCVTGATGFVGGHVARLRRQGGEAVRVTYRDRARLDRLRERDLEPVRADALDRGALLRALRDCRLGFHAAGYVGARPVERVWEVNALSPRLVVEAAAAAGVPRVVFTSSVAGVGAVLRGASATRKRSTVAAASAHLRTPSTRVRSRPWRPAPGPASRW